MCTAMQRSLNATQEGLSQTISDQLTATNSIINTQLVHILHTEVHITCIVYVLYVYRD